MSKAIPGNNKTFHDVILYFRLRLGRKSRKLELLCFYPICLKFGMGGNFEMLITKRKPELKLKMIFEQKNAIFYRF